MKILIIGGYGRFGGNLARLLSDRGDVTLIIAGRNLDKAKSFCSDNQGEASLIPLALDRANIGPALEAYTPDLVVDASGPFQIYGTENDTSPYSVPIACIEAGIHYFDLADSADLVAGISTLNTAAEKQNCIVLSGVSTCPALSGAVVKALAEPDTVTDICLGIAPSPRAELGFSVVEGILSYAGKQLRTFREGRIASFIGLGETLRYQITPGDYQPLENRLFCAVEAPELLVFPKHFRALKNIWVGAGTRPEFLLRLLNSLARFKAKINLPALTPLAPIAHKCLKLCRFGPHRGGMFVEVKTLKDRKTAKRSWHLIAEGDDGPLIPSIAAEALIRKILTGETLQSGARSAETELTLADFEDRFARHNIVSAMTKFEPIAPVGSEGP